MSDMPIEVPKTRTMVVTNGRAVILIDEFIDHDDEENLDYYELVIKDDDGLIHVVEIKADEIEIVRL